MAGRGVCELGQLLGCQFRRLPDDTGSRECELSTASGPATSTTTLVQCIAMETGVEVQRDKNICRISPSVTVNSAGNRLVFMS